MAAVQMPKLVDEMNEGQTDEHMLASKIYINSIAGNQQEVCSGGNE